MLLSVPVLEIFLLFLGRPWFHPNVDQRSAAVFTVLGGIFKAFKSLNLFVRSKVELEVLPYVVDA